MKKKIPDPTHPKGYYYGYESAEECLADFEANIKTTRHSDTEAIAGYACLWVFMFVLVALSVLAGMFKW